MIALGVAVTFAIVFRTQLAWNRPLSPLKIFKALLLWLGYRGRYWEAVTQLHVMYSKWADAYSQFQGFAEVTLKAAKAGPRLRSVVTTVRRRATRPKSSSSL